MITNFLHTKFTFVYIYIIFMLHFVKNEDGAKMTISYGEAKLEASLYTTNEPGKKLYELLKQKKQWNLKFEIEDTILYARNDEKGLTLIDETTVLTQLECEAFSIYANHDTLGFSAAAIDNSIRLEGIVIGKLISSSKSIKEFFAIFQNQSGEPFYLVFALDENQIESTPNYNIDLLLLIISIIIIILLIVCLLSFLTK